MLDAVLAKAKIAERVVSGEWQAIACAMATKPWGHARVHFAAIVVDGPPHTPAREGHARFLVQVHYYHSDALALVPRVFTRCI